MQSVEQGFTLIELAVALVVVTLLAGGVLLTTRVQLSQRQTSETRQALDEAREALLAFAAANGHLPCPARGGAPGLGQEARESSGNCAAARGLLPWETLGIRAIDGWDHRLAYLPSAVLAQSATPITLATGEANGNIEIRPGSANASLLASKAAVAAAVWSFGANGRFATIPDGATLPGASAGADETANGNTGSAIVVAREESENTAAPGGAFDDQMIWISRYVLFGRMMSAGQLP